MRALLYHVLFSLLFLGCLASKDRSVRLIKLSKLKKFVDDLPDMPRIKGYTVSDGVPISTTLSIGMYQKLWKFHRDLPPSPVFAYGITKATATVPGPTIEARQGVPTRVTWTNHLPKKHILPWDPTIPTAESSSNGIPTVVHLHGGIHGPTSDGNSHAWFTADFKSKGPLWSTKTYTYPNVQEPGNLWYHDHAMGLTRVNLLAGLIGSYTVRNPTVEDRLGLPSGDEYDRNLVVFDRSFRTDGSIYMNSTGNNPSIHPQWQPEYFGDAIIVNGKAWPSMRVRRRKYRFRIVNASNARFLRFRLSNGLRFVHVGSDSAYLGRPISTENFLLAPSEIADVVIDFAESETDVAVLRNDAPYPYPSGDPVNEVNGKVMRFVIERFSEADESRVPAKLMRYPKPAVHRAVKTRYIAMYEYESSTGEPTHLYLNGKSYDDPVTETPRAGTTEVWEIINLTDDNHPLHIHLGLLWVVEQRELVKVDEFKECMKKVNDAERCHVGEHARGRRHAVPRYERGWKNVFKMQPGFLTRVVVRFALLRPGFGYPFNVTGEPGYVYHCHILDHEDNVMMRPLKLVL